MNLRRASDRQRDDKKSPESIKPKFANNFIRKSSFPRGTAKIKVFGRRRRLLAASKRLRRRRELKRAPEWKTFIRRRRSTSATRNFRFSRQGAFSRAPARRGDRRPVMLVAHSSERRISNGVLCENRERRGARVLRGRRAAASGAANFRFCQIDRTPSAKGQRSKLLRRPMRDLYATTSDTLFQAQTAQTKIN